MQLDPADAAAVRHDLGRLEAAQHRNTREVLRCLDELDGGLAAMQAALESESDPTKRQVAARAAATAAPEALASISQEHKVFHAQISRTLKSLDKYEQDVVWPFDDGTTGESRNAMVQLIARHACWHGYIGCAEALQLDAGLRLDDAHLAHARDARALDEALSSGRLDVADGWLARHRQDLVPAAVQRLEFELLRLRFVALLRTPDAREHALAVQLAQDTMPRFYGAYTREAQQLMGSLLWAGRLDASPYADLGSAGHVQSVARLFIQASAKLRQLPTASHLEAAVGAGACSMPSFRKAAGLLAAGGRDLRDMSDLHVSLDVPPQLTFHSVFSCPVSRENATDANPPVLLRCGHAILRSSMEAIPRRAGRIKCPTCPVETAPEEALDLRI